MRVLVLGGTSFIGPAVVRGLLADGHDVMVVHRGEHEADLPAEVQHLHAAREDLAGRVDELRRFAPDAAIDMHAMTERHARQALDALRGLVAGALVVSSVDVYRAYGRVIGTEPGAAEPVPLAEDAPLRERLYPYRGRGYDLPDAEEYDKIPVERAFLDEPGLAATVVRLPAVYGPGDTLHRLWPYLRRMGDGQRSIALEAPLARWRWHGAYVDDAARAIVLAATDPRAAGRTYNAGAAEVPSVADWVRQVGAAAGWDGEVVVAPDGALGDAASPRPQGGQDIVADTTRIRRELGFSEQIDVEAALRRTIAWERANPPPLPQPLP